MFQHGINLRLKMQSTYRVDQSYSFTVTILSSNQNKRQKLNAIQDCLIQFVFKKEFFEQNILGDQTYLMMDLL